ncbi:glycosyltransferase [Microbacterium awajiense]|uniref:glycosyltransferase n=1 Tax=Microbacterium awajiense TaxID=415214 RepID=UPI0031D61409
MSAHTAFDGIVVAHDYLTQHGGAERVALQLAGQLDATTILTSVFRPDQTFTQAADFDVREIESALLRPFASDPRKALPFLAHAWSHVPPVEADAVVCSSSGWAHGLPVAEGTFKVVYCHNPARWLYQREDYTRGASLAVRTALAALSPSLRRWDATAALSADAYLANSSVVADRIRRVYGIEAQVVHPPVSIDADGPQEAVDGLDDGFFLTVARPRGYKGTEVLREAFRRMPDEQLVVVGAADRDGPPNVRGLGEVSESQLRWLYAHARALTSVSHEDFGLTPLEANAFGTPSLVLRAGGFLDSTDEGVSGSFIAADTVTAVVDAVRAFPVSWNRDTVKRHAGRFSADAFGRRMREVIDRRGRVAGGTRALRRRAVA